MCRIHFYKQVFSDEMLDWVFKSTQIYARISVIYLLKTGPAISSISPQVVNI